MTEVYVGVGSNIEREANLPRALRALNRRFGPLRVSSLYDSAAEGFEGPPFYNVAVSWLTELDAATLAAQLRELEYELGRPAVTGKRSSRPIDIDLLLHGDTCVDAPGLKLPRPDLFERAYVLAPMAEIAPDLRPPGCELSLAELWARFDRGRHEMTRSPLPWPEFAPYFR